MSELKFYKCKESGNILYFLKGEPCSNSHAELLTCNTVEASREKHIPVIEINGNKVDVCVGSVEHPMSEAHLIEWICLHTTSGVSFRKLHPTSSVKVSFALLEGEKVLGCYAYCNLHGLWAVIC